MKRERGSALVQVLVMSVLLTILATGVMKVMFMNHVVVARVQTGDKMRDVAEECRAKADIQWAGACGGPVTCGGGLYSGTATCAGGVLSIQVRKN